MILKLKACSGRRGLGTGGCDRHAGSNSGANGLRAVSVYGTVLESEG